MDDDYRFFRESSVEADPVLRQHLDQAWQKVLTTQLIARLEVLQRTESYDLRAPKQGGYSREPSLEPVGVMSVTPSPASSRTASPRAESIFSINSIDSNTTNSSKESSYSPICMSDYETKPELSLQREIVREYRRQHRKSSRKTSRPSMKSNKISKPSKRKSHDNFTASDDAHSMVLRSRSHNIRDRRAYIKRCGNVGCRKSGYRERCVP
ncbi:hypothetical protein B7463_g2789, partial [Scytalidium lignicola]